MLRPRQAITYVHTGSFGVYLFHANVKDVGATWFTFDTASYSLGTVAEGVVWIRGHHTDGSREGQALLAAYALDRCAA